MEDKNISQDDNIVACLAPIFGADTVSSWMNKECNEAKYKDQLSATTKMAVDNGAYGSPWWLITDKNGNTEPFFGSDRWAHICTFLDVPWYGSDPLSAPPGTQPSRL